MQREDILYIVVNEYLNKIDCISMFKVHDGDECGARKIVIVELYTIIYEEDGMTR